jgi:hypothetical protein
MLKSSAVDSASTVDPFGVRIKGHVGRSDEVLEYLIVAPDHFACIEKVKIWYSLIYLQNVGLQLSGGHDRDVFYLMHGSAEGDDGQFVT